MEKALIILIIMGIVLGFFALHAKNKWWKRSCWACFALIILVAGSLYMETVRGHQKLKQATLASTETIGDAQSGRVVTAFNGCKYPEHLEYKCWGSVELPTPKGPTSFLYVSRELLHPNQTVEFIQLKGRKNVWVAL